MLDDLIRPGWIFNATNDAWFGTSIGPIEHLASVRMRTVEEGLLVIRAANTVISAIIDADGSVVGGLEKLDRCVLWSDHRKIEAYERTDRRRFAI